MPEGMKPQPFDMQALKRVFHYMQNYKNSLILVVVCILLSSLASAVSSMFLQTLIDTYIYRLFTPIYSKRHQTEDCYFFRWCLCKIWKIKLTVEQTSQQNAIL